MNSIPEVDDSKLDLSAAEIDTTSFQWVIQKLRDLGFKPPTCERCEWTLSETDIDRIRQNMLRVIPLGAGHFVEAFETMVRLGWFGDHHHSIALDDYHELQRMIDFQVEVDRQLQWERAKREANRIITDEEMAAARGPRTKRTASEFAKIPPPPVVMHEVLAAEMNLVGGPSEAGKSLLARDWALAVATGTPWQGHRVSEARNVLWVASEGLHDFAERFTSQPAWADAKNQIFVLDVPVDLVHGNDVEWLLDEYKVERPGLVVFDVIYGMGMADDNGSRDVFPVIKAMKKISEAWGAATLALGHPPHGDARRMRGSSAWRQLTYTEWHMAGGSLSCEKSKIADKRRLSATYEVQYPDLRWLSMGEAVTNAVERHLIIQRDIEAYPDDNDSARARRLEPVLNMGDRQIKRYIKTVKDGLP